MTQRGRYPIGDEDVVTIKGRYLYKGDGDTRFFVKGIAFPIPPPAPVKIDIDGWITVLEQLANDTDINAVRIYDMDCYHVDDTYDPFLRRAAELGIYVIVPLTSSEGDGNLSRDTSPPDCYPQKLFHYGKTCIDKYWDRPNVLMGVIGNEVMNSFTTYKSAPCVKSYLQDLVKYSRSLSSQSSSSRKAFPLIYATQHDSPTSELHPDEAIKLTLDYLSCASGTERSDGALDLVFGINIESWCSSSESFDVEDDGITESSYHSLWRTFSGKNKTVKIVDAVTGDFTLEQVLPVSPIPVAVPVVFSEMGCSRRDFNRDNPLIPEDLKNIRDWKQIPLVSSEDGKMADLWSGFIAYAYDGGGFDVFRMMGGNSTKWNGKESLPPSTEYNNFRYQLSKVNNRSLTGESSFSLSEIAEIDQSTLSCKDATAKIRKFFGVKLYSLSEMPSYFPEVRDNVKRLTTFDPRAPPSAGTPTESSITNRVASYGELHLLISVLLFVLLAVGFLFLGRRRGERPNIRFGWLEQRFGLNVDSNNNKRHFEDENIPLKSADMNYGSM
ncbi:unnamed protein product [Pseudo-nitzschia multistriata]|uniref:Uncharacterized protein n=1 Tax=Pseudo-nitzschia multistriata TaxID=183589 RepID=A0A448Z635_9STRA|nr:unnamed protein product [Pseudo-nitzschia multistriata]